MHNRDDLARFAGLLAEARLPAPSFGCMQMVVASPEQLDDFQVGYAVERSGQNRPVDGDWHASWCVFARSFLDDPILVDLEEPAGPVFTAVHGVGRWDPVQVAPSFSSFGALLHEVARISVNRESPVALDRNPLAPHDLEQLRSLIEVHGANAEFWLDCLTPDATA